MTDACPHCRTTYGDLLRRDRKQLYVCRDCSQESCELCVVNDYSFGQSMALMRCPRCNGDSLHLLDLTTRFSIYSTIETLTRFRNGLALPFVPWSVFPRRTEGLVRKAITKLREYQPDFVLLNEDDDATRNELATWFPDRFQSTVAQGAGSLIWITRGVPVDSCDGGSYLTEYEILVKSRSNWTRDTEAKKCEPCGAPEDSKT